MKPRILILMHYMELGGAETSLIGLLEALDPNRVDVDLFIHSHQGPMMKYIPDWVNLLPEKKPYSVIERPITEAIKKLQFGVVWGRTMAKIKHRRYQNTLTSDEAKLDSSELQYVADCVEPFLPKINSDIEYDLCINYHTPHNYALSKVRAKKRMAWIHTDISKSHINFEQELQIWKKFDHIVSISEDVTKTFVKTYPSLAPQIVEIENFMPINMIKIRANEGKIDLPGKGIKLLSIGRFSYPKNFDNLPIIARKIVEKGICDLKWYIIGYGDETPIRKAIIENHMEDHVIILGKKENPYPYIKACDIYVQPSRYEGKSITVREAQILGKPVAITNYQTSQSQLTHGVDGVIVPLDNEACAQGLFDFINNKNLRKEIIANLYNNFSSSSNRIINIYNLL